MTDTMRHSRKLKSEPQTAQPVDEDQMPVTGVLESNRADIVDNQQTELLDNEATGTLVDEDATVALQESPAVPTRCTGGKQLKMLNEVMLIHTDEVI